MKKSRIAMIFMAIIILTCVMSGCQKSVKEIKLSKTELSVEHGQTFSLTASVYPEEASDKTITWNFDDDDVQATEDDNANKKEFLANKVGTTNISVRSSNGIESSCEVTITENAEDKIAREKAEEEARIAAEKKAEEERIAAEKKAEEERIAKERAEQEAKIGYETGISYNQLARNPDDYTGKKVKFYGRVIQVIEGDGETDLRVATKASYGSYYDDIVLVYYDPKIMTSRVLEDDMITLYGVSKGLHTYESTMGGNITVPLIAVDKIDVN